MRANELMIGDWVSALYDKVYYPCRVVAVFPTEVHVKEKTMVILTKYDEWNEVKPIPLTTEILDKNFRADKQWGENGWFVNDHIHIYRTTTGVYNIQYMEIVDIRYVHELQHALKLCGIDKTIEL